MLQMYCTPGAEKCREIGKKFVNDRLIALMDDAIVAYVDMFDEEERYRERITCSADWEKPLEEIVDLERLSHDEKFYDDYLDFNGLVPRTVGPQQALHDFFSLRRLLKARKEYKPELSMEYILYALIEMELDFCKDEPELHERRKRIPEPDRSAMMEELRTEAAENMESAPELYENETIEEVMEELMAYYEDLGEYRMTCFEDTDSLFLDDMDDTAMKDSGMADFFGFDLMGDSRKMRIESVDGGTVYEFDVSPWETEEG